MKTPRKGIKMAVSANNRRRVTIILAFNLPFLHFPTCIFFHNQDILFQTIFLQNSNALPGDEKERNPQAPRSVMFGKRLRNRWIVSVGLMIAGLVLAGCEEEGGYHLGFRLQRRHPAGPHGHNRFDALQRDRSAAVPAII